METAKSTQNKLLLKHLQQYGSITSMEAYELYGITRLSGRIYDLRHMGYAIIGTTESAVNRYGKKVKFRRYALAA